MHAPISHYLDAYNRLDVEAMLQVLHPEVVSRITPMAN